MKKILIIRLSSIGDIVLTSPILRCLKSQTNFQIHFLTKFKYLKLVQNNPNVDKVFSFKKKIDLKLIYDLKKEDYNLIVDLHCNLRTFYLKIFLNKKTYSLNKLNIKKWFFVKFKINLLPKQHIVDRYFYTLKDIISNDNNGLDFFIPKSSEIKIQSLPKIFHHGYIGLVICANHNTKKMPLLKLVNICEKLNKPVILLGGKEDFSTGEIICKKIGNRIFNSCGKYDIYGSSSIIKNADWIISNDTGLMHISAAFKKKIISVWGSTVPNFGMYPYLSGYKSKIIVNKISCQPCSKIGFDKCPKKHFKCMNHNVEEIIKDINYQESKI